MAIVVGKFKVSITISLFLYYLLQIACLFVGFETLTYPCITLKLTYIVSSITNSVVQRLGWVWVDGKFGNDDKREDYESNNGVCVTSHIVTKLSMKVDLRS